MLIQVYSAPRILTFHKYIPYSSINEHRISKVSCYLFASKSIFRRVICVKNVALQYQYKNTDDFRLNHHSVSLILSTKPNIFLFICSRRLVFQSLFAASRLASQSSYRLHPISYHRLP